MDGCPTFASAYVGRVRRGDPDFLYATPDRSECAAFSKESRMKFANANKLDRKSRGSPTIALNCLVKLNPFGAA
jgi:hypothetical protein